VTILKFWKTELSYAQSKNRGKKMRLLGMDTRPSLKNIDLNFWNFSDPIVEVNAMVRHFRQPWVLITLKFI
jgi:hypothetical protein